MAVELPQFKRCCFCIPLRYGILFWGYIKLIVSILYLIQNSSILLTRELRSSVRIALIILVITGLIIIGFLITFIYGAHTKNRKLLKIFYYVATVIFFFSVILSLMMLYSTAAFLIFYMKFESHDAGSILIQLANISIILLDTGMQGYLVLLIRSEVIKLKNNCQLNFVNNAADAECQLKLKADDGATE